MDTSKQLVEKDRRVSKSKEVSLKWIRTNNIAKDGLFSSKKYFKILDGKKVKYYVKITSDGIYDSCSCPSFKFGMKYPLPEQQTVPFSSLYFAEHGHTFHCKHILAAMDQKE